jgi:hypothetical protein
MRFRARLQVCALAALLGGCALKTPDLHVIRPASANLKFPNRISLGKPWTGDQGGAFKNALRARLRGLPEQPLVIDEQAPLRLDASVTKHFVDQTPVTRQPTTCTDYSKLPTTTHRCVLLRRKATIFVTIRLALRNQAGGALLDKELSFSSTSRTSRYVNAEENADEAEPPTIDAAALYASVIAEASDRFAMALAPHIETFTKPRLDCAAQLEPCAGAWDELSNCNYAAAERKFRTIAAGLPHGKAHAAALWGLAVTQELRGDFAASKLTLEQGLAEDADEQAFKDELAQFDIEQAYRAQLVVQRADRLRACPSVKAPSAVPPHTR